MNIKLLFSGLGFMALLLFSSCIKDKCMETRKFIQYNPIYVSKAEIHPGISVETSRSLDNPGKIYAYQNYIFINEPMEGVHVYDNSDPTHPQQLAFYKLPGNTDIAIKNGILYANVYFDIVGIDISNITEPTEAFRVEFGYNPERENAELSRYIVGYTQSDVITDVDCSEREYNSGFFFKNETAFVSVNSTAATQNTIQSPSSGEGGSTARFAFIGNYFYLVNESQMIIYDATTASSPAELGIVELGFGIETIFPYGKYIFIGANNGMHIYDNSNPLNPTFVSIYQHARACDPVVVNGNIAFVTLRDGTFCQNFTNQLDVLDLSDIYNPELLKTYPMKHPIGMATLGNNLYLCDTESGLLSYNIEDVNAIDRNLLTTVENISPRDVILLGNDHLLVVASQGFYQYDCSNPADLQLLSVIPVAVE